MSSVTYIHLETGARIFPRKLPSIQAHWGKSSWFYFAEFNRFLYGIWVLIMYSKGSLDHWLQILASRTQNKFVSSLLYNANLICYAAATTCQFQLRAKFIHKSSHTGHLDGCLSHEWPSLFAMLLAIGCWSFGSWYMVVWELEVGTCQSPDKWRRSRSAREPT